MPQETELWLKPGVHLACPGRDLVILNVPASDYLVLEGAASGLSFDPGERAVEVRDPALRQALLQAGLLALDPGAEPEPGSAHLSSDEGLAPSFRSPPSMRDKVNLVIAFGALLGHYPARSLGHLIEIARRRPASAGAQLVTSLEPEIQRRVAAFEQLVPFVPWQGECLARAFLLLMYLRAGGEDARWVFGVRTWPFRAHCWLQIGPVVLDDDPARVSAFCPILTV